jgi:xanthine dehydrogenase accessory factor
VADWRSEAVIDDIRPLLIALGAAAGGFAIATLVAVDGASPREIGAQMLITADRHWGFLSGGCVEDDIARHGRAAIQSGAPSLLRYGEGSPWLDIKLACGAGITVLVEPVGANDAAIATMLTGFATRVPVQWASNGAVRHASLGGSAAPPAWAAPDFTCTYQPAMRLVILGEDATALATAALANHLGVEVVLISPNGPRSSPIGDIGYHSGTACDAFALIGLDRWTAVAVVTHDREDDEQALAAALMSNAFYVGAIGARARLDGRLSRLRGHGINEDAISRLQAPIGMPGFGKSPRDIALSIVADVRRAFHNASTAASASGVSMSSTAPGSLVMKWPISLRPFSKVPAP